MATANVNNYESVIILDPTLSEDQQKDFFKKHQATIKEYDGEINHLDTWGQRALANPIKKVHRGTYFHTTFTANSNCVAELERTMLINDSVLRFIHVRLDNRTPIAKHLEQFKEALVESNRRTQEREAKIQAKKAMRKVRKPSVGK
ncbi:MAG: 30S ribosomal protein S6 [Bdellovibrionaceae bacterium]|nr:30S ribosomal protein S6 [Pseudobdellovibrionaceae bacterium]|tara:strand:+ start:290 stop:727 length:438 start_codon:yes stop_codon:yes gene_type:complete